MGESQAPPMEGRFLAVSVLDESGEPLLGAEVSVSIWSIRGEPRYPNASYYADDAGVAHVSKPRL